MSVRSIDGTPGPALGGPASRRFERLARAVKDLSGARTHEAIVDVVRYAARDITGALGVAIVLRDGDRCHYIAEDSAVPLWSGQKFPIDACISGWAMLQGQQVVIPDIYVDSRIPHEAYRPTGVHSLVMTPVGEPVAFGALGAYWRDVREASPDEISALNALASCMATALENIGHLQSLSFQANLLDAVGEAVVAADPDGQVTFWNRAAEELFGWASREVMGRQMLDIIPAPETQARARKVLAILKRGGHWAGEQTLRRRDGSTFPALVTQAAVRAGGGAVTGMIGVSRDISDRHYAERHKLLLINELNHRVKNTLTIVQSLAAQTLRGDQPLGAARRNLESRLLALANAHGLMTETEWRAVGVRELMERTMQPFVDPAAGQVAFKGPEVCLPSKAAVAFALAVHELCTNACKYGALSVAAGKVSVTWRLTDADRPRLQLTWRESGGPAVVEPAGRGFGSRLLERGLSAELQGEVRLEFHPEGLICAMDVAAPPGGLLDDANSDLFPLPR